MAAAATASGSSIKREGLFEDSAAAKTGSPSGGEHSSSSRSEKKKKKKDKKEKKEKRDKVSLDLEKESVESLSQLHSIKISDHTTQLD